MTAPIDYDDLRYMIAVAESGSTLSAARALCVSQSTVARRILALETAIGRQLFDKRRDGYRLTEAGRQLLPAAGEVAVAMRQFSLSVDQLTRAVGGSVRFTTNEVMAGQFVPDIVRRVTTRHPGVSLEVDASNVLRDLAAGEADVALRAAPAPQQPDLFGLRLAEDYWSLYCSKSYAALHGAPKSVETLADHSLIGLRPNGRHTAVVEWASRHFPPEKVVVRQNSVPAAFASIVGGLGVGFFSDLLAVGRDDVVFCFRPDLPPAAEIWLLTHERLRDTPRIRAVMDEVKAVFRERLRAIERA